MATKSNLTIDQGANFTTSINVTDANNVSSNLTNYTGAAQLRKHYTSNTATNFTVVVSANGNIKSHELACSLVAKKGFVNLYGGIPKNLNKKISFDSNMIHYKQASITGSFSSNQSHLNKAFRIIKNKI